MAITGFGDKGRLLRVLLGFMMVLWLAPGAAGKAVVEWDFSKGTHGWVGNQVVENLISSSEGLIIKSKGEDPWIEGPAVDLPGAEITRVNIRMRSTADTNAQFFYGRQFSEGQSVRFTVQNDGKWHEYALTILDKLGPGTRFRLDPCGGEGETTVAFINVETLGKIAAPPLEKPTVPDRTKGIAASVKSAGLEFEHYKGGWGNFAVKVDGVEMAAGYECELLGLSADGRVEWLDFKNAEVTFESPSTREFRSKATIKDSKGARWEIERRVKTGEKEGTIVVETEVRVNEDREVVHIPWLTISPGLGHSAKGNIRACSRA